MCFAIEFIRDSQLPLSTLWLLSIRIVASGEGANGYFFLMKTKSKSKTHSSFNAKALCLSWFSQRMTATDESAACRRQTKCVYGRWMVIDQPNSTCWDRRAIMWCACAHIKSSLSFQCLIADGVCIVFGHRHRRRHHHRHHCHHRLRLWSVIMHCEPCGWTNFLELTWLFHMLLRPYQHHHLLFYHFFSFLFAFNSFLVVVSSVCMCELQSIVVAY